MANSRRPIRPVSVTTKFLHHFWGGGYTSKMMRGRVAIVDDDESVRASLGLLFRNRGYDVVGLFADGAVAADGLPQLRPDFVILDVRMPRVDGLECLRLVRALIPHARIILFTGCRKAVVLSDAIMGGANGYVHKGCNETFLMLIQAMKQSHPAGLFVPHGGMSSDRGTASGSLAREVPPPGKGSFSRCWRTVKVRRRWHPFWDWNSNRSSTYCTG